MRKIEEEFADDVVVIGVHSGKYIAERETARIREAALRFDIEHPIVNDRQFRVWRAYAVRAWPTLAVIDRDGYVVGAHAGEFTAEMLHPLLESLVSMPARITGIQTPFAPERPAIEPGELRYPQKIAVDGERIAIADTGNRRVLLGRLLSDNAMSIEHEVNTISPRNRASDVTVFHSPQGLAYAGDQLLVVDSETHTLCAINTANGDAHVVAGTGAQMRTQRDREAGAFSSPWDVVVIKDVAYVAMAGIHQLWAINLKSGDVRRHSGTGGEDIVDGSNTEALLAQPMGITTDGSDLYVADAESSAIRSSGTGPRGEVSTIVGTGLFDFGDVDGVGDTVRLQHPQGIARHTDGHLLIADSYNDALKWVDPETREASTWLRGLHEPGGVALAKHFAYIADTNAHRVMVAELSSGTLRQLQIS